jgi:hypothetical protein
LPQQHSKGRPRAALLVSCCTRFTRPNQRDHLAWRPDSLKGRRRRLHPREGNAVGTALSSAYTARPTINAGGPQQQYAVNVAPGSTSISARIGNASDTNADLDLFLFDCHTGSCVLKAQSTSATANESVSVANPAAGTWVALVDPYSVPSGTTAYDYFDVFANPSFGSVSISDPAALHANGSTWSAMATATANAAPASGRYLQGFVQVVSGSSVLGSAEVDLKNVTP